MISVIVPVYNSKSRLVRCIDSICNQTYSDLEIILIDDGSSDGSSIVCDELAVNDSRIRVIHQNHAGVSAARNIGLSSANGDFFSFIDSDDWISPVMYEIMYNKSMEYDADIVECGFSILFQDHIQYYSSFTGGIHVADSVETIIGLTLWDGSYSVLWNKLYRNKTKQEVVFPDNRVHGDEFTTWKFVRNANKVVFIDTSLYYYDRTRENSITSTLNDNTLDKIDAFYELCCYAWERNIPSLIYAADNEFCRSSLQAVSFLWRRGITTERFWNYIRRVDEVYRTIKSGRYPLLAVYDECLKDTLAADVDKVVCKWEGVRNSIHHG